MKKVFFVSLCALSLLLQAQPAAAKMDPRCFAKSDCADARRPTDSALAHSATTDEGFYSSAQNSDALKACGEKIISSKGSEEEAGFCLPLTTPTTKIAIGGRTQFAGIGEFIAYLYKYSLAAGAVLAVVFLVVAGVQWTISAGDSSGIEEAKTRIAHALTGLVLLATSYLILYTVNPDLVNLRPVQAWLLRSVSINDPVCADLDSSITLTKIPGEGDTAESTSSATPVATKDAVCGSTYTINGTNGQTCLGSFCSGTGTSCADKKVNLPQGATEGSRSCVQGTVVGNIYSTNFYQNNEGWLSRSTYFFDVLGTGAGEGWIYGSIGGWSDNIEPYLVCADGTFEQVSQIYTASNDGAEYDTVKPMQFYTFAMKDLSTLKSIEKDVCPKGAKGYVFDIDLNEYQNPIDEEHFLGKDGKRAIDLGKNSSTVINSCIFRGVSDKDFLISSDEMAKGFQLDIDVSKFTDIDSDTYAATAWVVMTSPVTLGTIAGSSLGPGGAVAGGLAANYLFSDGSGVDDDIYKPIYHEFDSAYGRFGLNTEQCLIGG